MTVYGCRGAGNGGTGFSTLIGSTGQCDDATIEKSLTGGRSFSTLIGSTGQCDRWYFGYYDTSYIRFSTLIGSTGQCDRAFLTGMSAFVDVSVP